MSRSAELAAAEPPPEEKGVPVATDSNAESRLKRRLSQVAGAGFVPQSDARIVEMVRLAA